MEGFKLLDNVMLDIETMGNGPNAAIIAIGAAAFSIKSRSVEGEFYRTVNLESSVAIGGVIDASTVLWWMDQEDKARSYITRPETAPTAINRALDDFSQWLRDTCDVYEVKIWGNGAAFDNVIVSSAYKMAGQIVPWKFWNNRCYRTIKSLNPEVPMVRCGTHHNALDDAISQAWHLINILNPQKGE